ncbi:RNA-directed DNA polymerase, eukaryota [Tanacetum coccineum]|uniref:RNA-directed DNA polymerase, eukaryota n=1 Tax=Tanacetum coccineum TaxID=301880 RepID=A0ABQ4WYZ8_9ASTR
MRKISSWWNIDYSDVNSYEEWRVLLVSIRIQSKLKGVLEGVYYDLWWYMLNFRNKLLFDKKIPEKALIFDNLLRSSKGHILIDSYVQKGVILESTSCPVCFSDEEDVHHLLFRCSLSQEVLHRVCRWWEIDFQLWRSFSEWDEWFSSIRLPGSVKGFLEGVFYVAWWFIWGFRNRSTFDVNKPSRSILLRILSLLPFFGVIVGVVGSSLGMIGLKTRI